MTYDEARQFIEQCSRFGERLGLASVRELLRRLGNPQDARPVIHIAGTNGKGSIFAFLEAGLRAGGYRVGRYISPTLFTYLERYQIDGRAMEREDFASLVEPVAQACAAMQREGYLHPTAFEVETAVAFLYFCRETVDVVLLETGMGGEEDATNVVARPLLTVFSCISLDHMKFLGDTLEEIARHKAGIMRDSVPVVAAPMPEPCRDVLRREAAAHHSRYIQVERPECSCDADGAVFVYGKRQYRISLLGTFQPENAACAIAVWEQLRDIFPMRREVFSEGLLRAAWRGRFEVLRRRPWVIRDGAHNADAVRRLCQTLQQLFADAPLRFVMGVFKDKDYTRMLAQLAPLAPSIAAFYTVTPPNARRALDAGQLCAQVRHILCEECGSRATVRPSESVPEALRQAVSQSGTQDVVVVFGSLSLASLCDGFDVHNPSIFGENPE